MNEERPTHLDLFSGIGGFSLAFQSEGFQTIGFSEIEKYACGVLQRRFPAIPNLGDVRTIQPQGATVLTGGIPCQPWSGAGKRKGTSDVRHLWPAMCNVVASGEFSYVVVENVDDFVSMGGADLVLNDLEKLNYYGQPFIISASSVGAWHLRDRLFIVAYSEEKRQSEARKHRQGKSKERTSDRNQEVSHSDAVQARCQEFNYPPKSEETKRDAWGSGGSDVEAWRYPNWDCDESEVMGMADGVSLGLDSSERNGRIAALGNAVVPQVIRPIAQAIYAHWKATQG